MLRSLGEIVVAETERTEVAKTGRMPAAVVAVAAGAGTAGGFVDVGEELRNLVLAGDDANVLRLDGAQEGFAIDEFDSRGAKRVPAQENLGRKVERAPEARIHARKLHEFHSDRLKCSTGLSRRA